jgi:hypothetical protein
VATRKGKNIKTHPDPDEGGFVSPERTDLNLDSREDPVTIDLQAGTEEVDLNATEDQLGTEGKRTDQEVAPRQRAERVERPERQERTASEDDGGNYGANVRKRLRRERNLLNRERELRLQTDKKLKDERTARLELEQRLGQVERRQNEVATNGDVKSLETKISSLRTQLLAAIEAGESTKQLDLQIQLGDAQADLKVLKYKLEQQHASAEADGRRRQEQSERAASDDTDTGTALTPDELAAAADWQKANRHWFRRPSMADAKKDAIAIDLEILQDIRAGDLDMDLYSEEHFEELARRLVEAHPDLQVVDPDGNAYSFDNDEDDDMRDERNGGRRDTRDDGRGDRRNGGRQTNTRGERLQGRGTGGRSPQGGIGQGGRRQPNEAELARQGKVSLNGEDFNTMRTFGMDPHNAEHKKAFAKERRRSILTDANRGTR